MAPSVKIDVSRQEVFVGKREVKLCNKEFRLLKALYESGKTLSRLEILKAIGSDEIYSEGRVADQHVARIRRKLGPGAIITVACFGYKAPRGSLFLAASATKP